MRVKCESCAAGYTLPASKLKPGRRVQFACRRCGHRIVVAVPAPEDAARSASRSRISGTEQVTGSRQRGPASSLRAGRATGGATGTGGGGAVVRPRGGGAHQARRKTGGGERPVSGAASRTTGGEDKRGPRRDPLGRHLSARKPQTTGKPKGDTETQVKWFVAHSDGSHRKMLGPELKVAIQSGELDGDALIWRKGWPEWRPASQAAEWQPLLSRLSAERVARVARQKQALASSSQSAARPAVQRMGVDTAPDPEPEPVQREVSATRMVQVVDDAQASDPQATRSTEPAPEAAQQKAAVIEERRQPARQDRGHAESGTDAAAAPEPATRAEARQPAEPAEPAEESTSLDVAARVEDELPEDALLQQGSMDAEAGEQPLSQDDLQKSQRAVSLPIVRVKTGGQAVVAGRSAPLRSRRDTASPKETAAQRRRTPSGRFAAGRPASGTPIDGQHDPDSLDSAWAPATDTYIGPRDRFTRKLGSDEQRQELLARVEYERAMVRQLRFWQWIALGSACAAIFAFGLTVYALISLRITEGEMKNLRSQVSRPAITAPATEETP